MTSPDFFDFGALIAFYAAEEWHLDTGEEIFDWNSVCGKVRHFNEEQIRTRVPRNVHLCDECALIVAMMRFT